jgi:hypothetical protein
MIFRVSLFVMFVSLFAATSATAGPECSVKDAVVSTGIGAGVGAVAGVAAVWTVGVLAAPFTLGSSLWGAVTMTGPAIALGAKGGAFYGASAEAIDCGTAAKDRLIGSGEDK